MFSRRELLVRTGLASAALTLEAARAQPAQEADPRTRAVDDLVVANRILADQGVLDGYGHVSVRSPGKPDRFLLSRSLAPELVTAADVLEHDLDGNAAAPPGATLFLERFLHAGVYRARPDVNAVVHSHSPSVIPFGATLTPLRPIYHMSAFLRGGVPVFDIRKAAGETDMLIRTPELGGALAKALGPHAAALMRGHGAVVVAEDLPHAVFRSVYTELNARLQAQAISLGGKVTYLDDEEARKAEATMGSTVQRPWDLWRRKAMAK
jgi:HCOMODA/2-hydroxy-3-carboxy-muconic semialdehyde decarboxylase